MEFDLVDFETLFKIPLKNGLSKPKKIRGIGYPMVNMGELFKHDIIFDIDMDFVPMNEREKTHSYLKKYDLLFARQSLTLAGAGKCSIFLGESCETTYESHLIRVRLDQEKCNPLFYYYYFQSQHGKSNMSNIVEQVAAAGIRGSDLKKLKVPYVEKSIQDTIVKLLYGFDEKIELNKQIINNIQEITKNIFKHWFINFEFPNEEGQPYKSSGGNMVESEIGCIPVNWKVKSLNEIATVKGGKRLPKGEKVQEKVTQHPYIRVKDFNDRTIKRENINYISAEIHEKIKNYTISSDDIYISVVGTVGITGLIPKSFDGANLTENANKITVTNTKISKYFVLEFLNFDVGKNQIHSKVVGSTQPKLPLYAIKDIKIMIPENELLLSKANVILEKIYSEIDFLQDNSQTLKAIRNTLLPEILSGKIEIPKNLEVE